MRTGSSCWGLGALLLLTPLGCECGGVNEAPKDAASQLTTDASAPADAAVAPDSASRPDVALVDSAGMDLAAPDTALADTSVVGTDAAGVDAAQPPFDAGAGVDAGGSTAPTSCHVITQSIAQSGATSSCGFDILPAWDGFLLNVVISPRPQVYETICRVGGSGSCADSRGWFTSGDQVALCDETCDRFHAYGAGGLLLARVGCQSSFCRDYCGGYGDACGPAQDCCPGYACDTAVPATPAIRGPVPVFPAWRRGARAASIPRDSAAAATARAASAVTTSAILAATRLTAAPATASTVSATARRRRCCAMAHAWTR